MVQIYLRPLPKLVPSYLQIFILLLCIFPRLGVSAPLSIPEISRWESQMISFGRKHCASLLDTSQSAEQRLAATYYDAQYVYYMIYDYTKDPYWNRCADAAEGVYRDQFVIAGDGKVPGYWNFTHGLTEDYLRTKDSKSKEAVILISKKAAFATDNTPIESTESTELSREVAYTIMSYLNAERLGEPRRARLEKLVSQAFRHLDGWFVKETAPYVRPFMVALTAHSLIMYHGVTDDPRVVSAIKNALDWIWDRMWIPSTQAFMYTDRVHESGGTEPSPDLNLIIAPVFAWLYLQTGDSKYRTRGDDIFSGGVRKAWLDAPKQFNQSYRWSFDYLRWRRMESKKELLEERDR